ncbi:MAG: PQQ-binding-like beta-propeller repeat protein [Phycisphaerales bacterium]|nr:PQQ-binding-like beta-propeller repeat protein [Phycisphaerales bacterium]
MPHGLRISHPDRFAHRSAFMVAGFALLLTTLGCQPPNKSTSSEPEKNAQRLARQQSVRDHLEQTYTIGPVTAAQFGYDVQWQFPVPGQKINFMTPQDDRLFILTDMNDLICLQADNGRRIWTVSVAGTLQNVHSVTYLSSQELVLVLADNMLLTLDSNTGMTQTAIMGKSQQDLEWLASTPGALHGEYLIYGSRSGQLIWQAWQVGFAWKAYQVAHALRLSPIIRSGVVCCTSPEGIVSAFTATTASQLWNTELLDNIVAPPAASDHALYVAGIDQHLRAFDLHSGRTLWRVLTESSLVDSPVLIGQHVYQQIPNKGLAAFAALPVNKLDGERTWICPSNTGSVLTRNGSNLITWDPNSHTIARVSVAQGTAVNSKEFPRITDVISDGLEEGTLLAISEDGRLVCLSPLR